MAESFAAVCASCRSAVEAGGMLICFAFRLRESMAKVPTAEARVTHWLWSPSEDDARCDSCSLAASATPAKRLPHMMWAAVV